MAEQPKSAAAALYPNLSSADRAPVAQRRQPNIGDAMWPALSHAHKMKEAEIARALAEQRERSKRTAANLQSVLDDLRREKERGR